MMHVSEQGLAFNGQREALVLSAHRDTANLAISFGLNLPTLREGDTMTFDEAIAAYVDAAQGYDESLNIIFADMPLKQQHWDALFSACWNVGATNLRNDKALVEAIWRFSSDHTIRKNRDWAAYHLSRVRFSEIDGPFNFMRRCAEAQLFIGGNYGDLSTLKFWDVGKLPRNPDGTPKDPPEIIPMPRFIRN